MIDTPQRALVVFPHPDDAEFGCAGTVARWARQGAAVYYLLCTDGDKGSSDPQMTSERLAALRHKEQRDAAAVLGVKEVLPLHYPDGELEDSRGFRRQVARAIRRFRPEVVLCPDPFHHLRFTHRDHRIAGQVTLDAIFPYARDRLHFPELLQEGLEPHKVAMALLWGSDEPDTFIDIGETIDLKIKALLCHQSQLSHRSDWNPGERLKEWAREQGKKAGVEYAEAFRKVEFRR